MLQPVSQAALVQRTGQEAALASLRIPMRLVLWGVGFVVALVVAFAWTGPSSAHTDFAQNVWLPSRLVLDGANPYSPTRPQVDAALGQYAGDFQAFNSGADYRFIYPIWLALVLTPFGALPLLTATAIWRALNLLLLVWAMGAVLRASSAAFRSNRAAALFATTVAILVGVIYRESILTLFIGQFSIIELGLLVAIWRWLVSSAALPAERQVWGDVAAGVALAVLATKPQVVGLPVLLLAIWALSRRRWAIPVGAVASLAALLLVPLAFYPGSLGDWLSVVFGMGQATSQVSVSASVWGVSYQWLGDGWAWVLVAGALTLGGLALLVPGWWRDLRDRTSPVPLSLPLTICVNSVVSPYMLGYEQVLLLLPALVYLAAAGLPGDEASEAEGRDRTLKRAAIFIWMGVLSWLVVAVQGAIHKGYPAVAQSVAMLAICWVAALRWEARTDRELASGSNT